LIFVSSSARRSELSYREVSVIEVREVLRAWMAGVGLRTVAARARVDRKTARYAEIGITRTGGIHLTDVQ
jgi:hypothetical protein